jgi:serine protease Do
MKLILPQLCHNFATAFRGFAISLMLKSFYTKQSERGVQIMNNEIINNERVSKKGMPRLKMAMTIVCAFALMIGSGFMGAHITRYGEATSIPETEPLAAISPSVMDSDRSVNLLSTVVTTDAEMSLPELFEGVNPAVVAISTEITGRNAFGMPVTRPSAGSGFFITADGFIVTNDHVIENASNITVLVYDGTELSATVVGRDSASDLAVIKVEGKECSFLSFGDSDVIRVGEQVAAIGNPLGQLANSMTVGYISALNRDVNIDGVSRGKIQTDAAVNRGNSGGPLMNLQGEVIGVVSAKSVGMDVEGLGFAIPSNHVNMITSDLIQYGFVRGRAALGVSINTQQVIGNVLIVAVNNDSAAERAGLLVGDVILSIDGTNVVTFTDLKTILDARSPGDTVELLVRRSDADITLTAVLDEYTPNQEQN